MILNQLWSNYRLIYKIILQIFSNDLLQEFLNGFFKWLTLAERFMTIISKIDDIYEIIKRMK